MEKSTHVGSVVHSQSLQSPGKTEPNQDVKHIAPDGIGHGHIPHPCKDKRPLGRKGNSVGSVYKGLS